MRPVKPVARSERLIWEGVPPLASRDRISSTAWPAAAISGHVSTGHQATIGPRSFAQPSRGPRACLARACLARGSRATVRRMAFWACAQLDRRHERMALHCLALSGTVVYQPRIKSRRESEPLFANYIFVAVEFQWHVIRWSPGVLKLIMAGDHPAQVGDGVIEELRAREGRDGLIRLPKRSSLNGGAQFQRGDQVRVRDGALRGFVGLVEDMKPHARIEILLQMLGSVQRVELSAASVERVA